MTILVVYENEAFKEPIEYVFSFILLIYGVPWQLASYTKLSSPKLKSPTVVISYGRKKPCQKLAHHIHIYESRLFGQDYLESSSMPETPLRRFNDLPIIYGGYNEIEGHVRREGGLIEADIDIIASSFFMLTRYEEVVAPVQDEFERYPAAASLAYREGFLDRPIVNEYIELLWSWIDSLNLGLKRKKPWGGRNFAVCLTHDVDRLRKFRLMPPLFTFKRVLFERRELKKAWRVFMDYLRAARRSTKDPYLIAFDRLLNLEKAYGYTSTFYFMADGEDYSIGNPDSRELVRDLRRQQCEVGLHGSFDSYTEPDALDYEKEQIEEALGLHILGTRQHFLRWKTPETWRSQEKAGLKYDTTLSFADHVGFRCGACYPYKPFDVVEGRALDIWEVPLILMDGSLFGYQSLSLEEGWQVIKALIDTVERYGGVFVVLWHNSSFYELESPRMLRAYEQMLDYISKKNALCSTLKEVLAAWHRIERI